MPWNLLRPGCSPIPPQGNQEKVVPTFPLHSQCLLADLVAPLCGPVWCAMPPVPGIVSIKNFFVALADLAWWIEHQLEN